MAATAAPAPVDSARPGDADRHRPVVLFFGDSLTAGYGVDRSLAFPALLQARADSAGCSARMVDAGVPGETSAAGLRRVDWVMRRPVDLFVLELGGNDGLRGVPPAETERNLAAILERVRARRPAVRLVVAGVRLPPNLGADYGRAFHQLFARVAANHGAILIPRLLEGVGGDPELMQADGIHPNAAGHRRVAATLWETLQPLVCGAAASGEPPAGPGATGQP